jgi:hypothetical protein
MKVVVISLFFGLFCLIPSAFAGEKMKEKEQAPASKFKDKDKPKAKPKAVATGDKIYTWIDEKGNKIYSDVPRDGAKLMEIKKGTDYTPDQTIPDWSKMKPKVIPAGPLYEHFQIASPGNDATVRNNDGYIQIALDIRPKLVDGHRVQIEVDGKAFPGTGASIIALNNVDRGTHTIIAYILAANDKVLATTPPVIVHMHRAIQRAR